MSRVGHTGRDAAPQLGEDTAHQLIHRRSLAISLCDRHTITARSPLIAEAASSIIVSRLLRDALGVLRTVHDAERRARVGLEHPAWSNV